MRALILSLLLLFAIAARADDGGLLAGLVSAPLTLQVTISGSDVELDSYVVRPDQPGRFPLVVITHGTPSASEAFARRLMASSPIDYLRPAVAFAERGYAAVAVMRR